MEKDKEDEMKVKEQYGNTSRQILEILRRNREEESEKENDEER